MKRIKLTMPICNNCLTTQRELVQHKEQYYCVNCYKNISKNKEKNKWIIILSASIILLLIGIGLLLFWFFKK